MKLRYPGPKPFSSNEQALFFGREEETEKLNQLLYNNRITVLFGRSGYGKSSLIQAGVVNHFSNQVKYKIVQIRFTSMSGSPSGRESLKSQMITELKNLIGPEELFMKELTGEEEPSLWQIFKTLQWKIRKEKTGILFILDQFEEVFNFSEDYLDFSYELAELVHNRMPAKFQEQLMNNIEANQHCVELNREAINFIDAEIPTSFLIGIRSDRIFLLDELGESIPAIFNNRFSIGPLSLDKLDSIIRQPALLEGDFDALKFEYSDGLVASIREYLAGSSAENKRPNTIEGFEFQIICQYIERRIIERQKQHHPDPGKMLIADESLVAQGFIAIIENYYINSINGLEGFDEFERLITRFLIERKLIDLKTDTRVCLDKTSIIPLGFNNSMLRRIIETRMVRKELNTVSGESFELSHDTLVKAIRRASGGSELGQLDRRILDYYNKATRGYVRYNPFRSPYFLETKLIDRQGNLVRLDKESIGNNSELAKNVTLLQANKIVNEEGTQGNKAYVLNEVFRDTVMSKVNRNHLSVVRKYAVGFFFMLAMFLLIIVLAGISLNLLARENALRISTMTDVREKNDAQSNELLHLFTQLYGIVHQKDTAAKSQLSDKLVRQFNNLFPYSHSNRSDSIDQAEYSISSDDSILLELGNQMLPPGVVSRVPLKIAQVFDIEGKVKKTFRDVDDAVLFNKNIVIFKKDSLRIYPPDSAEERRSKGMLLNKLAVFKQIDAALDKGTRASLSRPITPSDLTISEITPLTVINNRNFTGTYKVICRLKLKNGFMFSDSVMTLFSEKLLAIFDVQTGNVIPLQSIYISDLNLPIVVNKPPGSMTFPVYYLSDSGGLSVLTKQGYLAHYLEYTDLRASAPHMTRVPIPAGFYPLPANGTVLHTNFIFVSNSNYDSIRSGPSPYAYGPPGVTPTLQFVNVKKMTVSGVLSNSRKDSVAALDIRQNADNTLTLTSDSVRVWNFSFSPVFSLKLPKNSWIFRELVSLDEKVKLFSGDSVLSLVTKDSIKAVNMRGPIYEYTFSQTGDSIYCVSFDNLSNLATLHILNRQLEELFVCNNHINFGCDHIKGLSLARKDNRLYIIPLSNPRTSFNNSHPLAIIKWMNSYAKTPAHLSDSLSLKYHFVGRGKFDQFLSLFHDN